MSNSNQNSYQSIAFSKTRQFVTDVLALGHQKHLIHGLLELDVTDTRRRLRALEEKTGAAPSFTGFVIGCIARAVAENKMVHAYRGSGERLVLFDDVDVATMIEVEKDGTRLPVGHVIRGANRLSLREIHEQIRRVQSGPRSATTPAGSLLSSLPAFLRRLVYRTTLKQPQAMKERAGTVLVTAVGMFGNGGGWGIPISMHTLTVTLGGICEKPGVVEGEIQIREYLSVTVSFDHDIVDGAPAARFAKRLQELVEGGFGLGSWDSGRPVASPNGQLNKKRAEPGRGTQVPHSR